MRKILGLLFIGSLLSSCFWRSTPVETPQINGRSYGGISVKWKEENHMEIYIEKDHTLFGFRVEIKDRGDNGLETSKYCWNDPCFSYYDLTDNKVLFDDNDSNKSFYFEGEKIIQIIFSEEFVLKINSALNFNFIINGNNFRLPTTVKEAAII